MEKVDVIIIGAGVIGLAAAEKLSAAGKEIIVVERHDGFGREASSRNSEVIHAGMYYPEGSLKAKFCVKGNRQLYELCGKRGIPYKKPGKIIVGQNDEETHKINDLYEQGMKNGVSNLQLLEREAVLEREPNITGATGLLSPETGIIDTHSLMKYFEQSAESRGTIFAYSCEVVRVRKATEGYITDVRDADGEMMQVRSDIVINAAGLAADRIAASVGIDVEAAGYGIHPCKGEYFSVSNRHRRKLNGLVYPVPTAIHLGIHVVLDLEGCLKLGPSAFYVDTIDYDVEPSHRQEFFKSARTYLPFIEYQDLAPDMAGIRAKLQRPEDDFRDFVIAEESDKGFPGLINLIGMESPALTACMAIADEVAAIIG